MTVSEQIDQHIAEYTDWRGALLDKLRSIIHEVDPDITEEWKWGTPVFSRNGMVCALGAFSDHVKINFFKGASLPDPKKLFNAGLEAKTSRGIDIFEGEEIQEAALKELLSSAVAFNVKKK